MKIFTLLKKRESRCEHEQALCGCYTCVAQKKVPTTQTMESRLPPLCVRGHLVVPDLAPNFFMELYYGRPDFSSLVSSRVNVCQSDGTIRALLRRGFRRRSLKMWLQALEVWFVSCTSSQVFLFCCRTRRKNYLWVPPARSTPEAKYLPTVVRETENSSAWNPIFKLQRRGPPRRRTRKVLWRWRTHRKEYT